tara:strand:+ start:41476 stop:41973 length:498 start_codon:yes stop_codon:yes gene_type:complete
MVVVGVGQLFSQVLITGITPKNESLNFIPEIVFEWNKYIAESSSGFYNLSVSSNSLFENTLTSKNRLLTTKDSIAINTEGKYYWRADCLENGPLVSSSRSLPFFYVDLYSLPNFDLLLRADIGVILSSNRTVARWINLADTLNNVIQTTINEQPSLMYKLTVLNG